MLRLAPPLAVLSLVLSLVMSVAAAPAYALAKRPVVVELFTSQGCRACTKANALIADLADRKDVLALTFPVDYWDYLGWKDTFAKPEFSARQRGYMKVSGAREVYTPDLVIDGAPQTDKGATDKAALDKARALIDAAAAAEGDPPAMRLSRRSVEVGAGRGPAGGADVWLVRYQPQPQETPVRDGENRGVTVVYRNVVVGLERLGAWSGNARSYPVPRAGAQDGELKTAVLLQAHASGRILGVLKP
jgi:hypothetical protein